MIAARVPVKTLLSIISPGTSKHAKARFLKVSTVRLPVPRGIPNRFLFGGFLSLGGGFHLKKSTRSFTRRLKSLLKSSRLAISICISTSLFYPR